MPIKGDYYNGIRSIFKSKNKNSKTKKRNGACGGLFPFAPANNGTTEIGYWRKAYAVSDYLRNVLEIDDAFNLEDKEITYEQVIDIITYAQNVLSEKDFADTYEESDWLDTVDYFTTAKEILENDSNAQIFYMEWY